jgi:tRNA G18 (ribose-2'-O)-methylase SpoU
MKKKHSIYIILENVRSLYNVGAIFRTSDGAGVEKIFLCGITGFPPRPEIAKTALGAEDMVSWEHREEASDVIEELRSEGVEIVGVELAPDAENYWDVSYDGPVCFVFGHEVEGVSEEILGLCDRKVFVPMYGKKESLNVEAAFSTVVYEAVRKFNNSAHGED